MCGAWRDGAAAHGVVFDDEPSGSRGAFGAVGRGAFGGHPVVARLCRGAFPGARRWQNAREMRSPSVRQRQDIAPMRSWAFADSKISPWRAPRAAIRGNISPWRIPGQSTVAAFSPHAFPKGPRAGKAPVRGKISPPCIRNELVLARFARHASEKPCKQPSGNTLREDLAAKAPFSRPIPSNHARRAYLAMNRRRHTRPAQKRSSEAVGASTPSRLPCL